MPEKTARKSSAYSQLKWNPVKTALRAPAELLIEDEPVELELNETDPFLRAFLEEGISAPSVSGASNAREEFIGLLRAAAEIEHALMVQYLYAWFTSGPEDSRIGVLQEIAVQEMGHLFSVQNLLRSLGESVHLFLPEPSTPVQNAHPFPLYFGTASKKTLAQYVTAESPLAGTLTGDVQAKARAAAADAMIEVRHVGILFLKLYWLAQPSASPGGPWEPPLTPRWATQLGDAHVTFGPMDISAQRSWRAEWDVGMDAADFLKQSAEKQLFVARLTDSTVPYWEQTCRLFYSIGAQGEGYVDDPNVSSHFESFLELYNGWDNDGHSVVPTLENPWVGLESSDPVREASRLTDPEAVTLAAAFNLRYERILVLIAITFTPQITSQTIINTIRSDALRDMRSSLVTIAGELLKRPAKAGSSGGDLRAGPTFQAPEIPVEFNALRTRLAELKSETAGIPWPGGVPLLNADSDQRLLDQLAAI